MPILVLAARVKDGQHHHIGIREQQPLGLLARCFRGARDETQMLAARQRAQVLQANPRQAGDFLIREQLLA